MTKFGLFIALVIASLSFPSAASAAILYRTSVSQVVTTTSNTVSMTIPPGVNLLVCYSVVDLPASLTSVTWNGTPLTQFATVSGISPLNTVLRGLYLLAPTSGTANIVSTQSASGGFHYIMCSSYSGAKQQAPEATATYNPSGAATSLVQSITTLSPDAWAVSVSVNDNGGLAAGNNSALRGTALNSAVGYFDSAGPVQIPQSFSMTQLGNNGLRAGIIASIAPLEAATAVKALINNGVRLFINNGMSIFIP